MATEHIINAIDAMRYGLETYFGKNHGLEEDDFHAMLQGLEKEFILLRRETPKPITPKH